MCPFCIATAAVIAGSATGTGGIAALVAGVFVKRNKRKLLPQNEAEEVQHDDGNNGNDESEDRITR